MPSNHQNGLPDADSNQDHKRPDNHKLRPRPGTETPLGIGWKTVALPVGPQEGNTSYRQGIGSDMHHTAEEDSEEHQMRCSYKLGGKRKATHSQNVNDNLFQPNCQQRAEEEPKNAVKECAMTGQMLNLCADSAEFMP